MSTQSLRPASDWPGRSATCLFDGTYPENCPQKLSFQLHPRDAHNPHCCYSRRYRGNFYLLQDVVFDNPGCYE